MSFITFPVLLHLCGILSDGHRLQESKSNTGQARSFAAVGLVNIGSIFSLTSEVSMESKCGKSLSSFLPGCLMFPSKPCCKPCCKPSACMWRGVLVSAHVWESFLCGCENMRVCEYIPVEVCVCVCFSRAWRPEDCGRTSSVDPLCFLFKE